MTPIPEIISDIVVQVRTELGTEAPYYEYGRLPYIANQVDDKTKNITNVGKIFPLIALLGDIKETVKEGSRTATITVIFFAETKHDYSNTQRYSTTFPNLYTILDLFVKHMGNDSRLVGSYPEYTQLDSAYYKGQFNALSSFTDVIACEFDIEVLESVCEYVEPTTFDLILTAETGGTTVPAPGTYTENNGAYKAFYADVNAGYEFSYWLINGQQFIDNPIEYRYLSNATMQAKFTSLGGILTPQIKVFDSAPVLKGNSYYFGDHSTKDNDVLVKNVKVGNLLTGYYVQSQVYLQGGSEIDIELDVFLKSYNFLIFNAISANKGFQIYTTNSGQLFIVIGNGTSVQNIIYQFISLGRLTVKVQWNGLIGGTITYTVNDVINTITALYQWSGNAGLLSRLGHNTGAVNMYAYYCHVKNHFTWILNHGQGAVIYDISGNGNSGTITDAVLSTFWGSNSDDSIPYDLTLGATLYQKDSDQTIMPICFDTSQAITGYTRLGYFPAGSGILRGLPNKYTIPVSVPGMPAGDYTEAEIRALTPSNNIVKTENTNTISLLEGRIVE
jgi:hypothetical protein